MRASDALTEEMLGALVPAFYARVRRDEILGPVFNGAVDDWNAHHSTLVDFWSSVTRASGRYKGNPMGAHLKHAGRITEDMFDRWLGLWCEVTSELLPSGSASQIQQKARNIADSLKMALFYRPDQVSGVRQIRQVEGGTAARGEEQ
jgi:hemoglobin